MITAVIKFINYTAAKQQIQNIYNNAECLELRLDYIEHFDLTAIAKIKSEFNLPMIFTLRKKSEGGHYQHNEQQRLLELDSLCSLRPEYLDIEYDVGTNFINYLKNLHPSIKLICSYHNFNETPIDLERIFEQMYQTKCHYFKIATTANNTIDALKMLQFTQKINSSHKSNLLTGFCMGVEGSCTRILGKIFGNQFTYASTSKEQETAPGQFTVDELINIYNFKSIDENSKIYALLGNPITFSVGHILHNKAIKILRENAIYIKLKVTPNELQFTLQIILKLSFHGFSVTMPLKEVILPLVNQVDVNSSAIKSINTVKNDRCQLIGLNTDGIGAIQALAKKIKLFDAKIIILGAGGAARAIAYEAIKQGAIVVILNRHINKAEKIAQDFNCESNSIYNLPKLKKDNYDVLINTLPRSAYVDKDIKKIISYNNLPDQLIIMDIIYPEKNTPLLNLIKHPQFTAVYGYEMYIKQALLQLSTWFNPSLEQLQQIELMMSDYFLQS